MAELYLNYAEAANQFNGPSQEVYDAINTVRSRSGVNDVEDAWENASKTPNKHLEKNGLQEIIQHERLIEMAFEGHRYQDLRRWKLADQYFNSPIKGWSPNESSLDDYYQVQEIDQRIFKNPRDYFHPIKTNELIINNNLIQNPDW